MRKIPTVYPHSLFRCSPRRLSLLFTPASYPPAHQPIGLSAYRPVGVSEQFQAGFEGADLSQKLCIIFAFFRDRPHRVHDGGVVPSAEVGADFFK